MKPLTRSATVALLGGLLTLGACAGSEVGGGTTPGSGGSSSGTAGTPGSGSGGSGTPGSAGSGTPGSAGSGTPGSAGSGTPGSAGSGTPGSAGSTGPGTGGTGTPGAGGTGTPGTGGSGTAGTGTPGTAGTIGTAGTTGTGGRGGSAAAGRGGSAAAGRGGSGGSSAGGTGGTSSMTGMGGSVSTTPLDCGPQGYIVENHGPAANRLNYIILGDGFQSADLAAGGVFEQDLTKVMTRRFSPNATPFNRYRNFINICGIKLVDTAKICTTSLLGCCGDDTSRLANCDMNKVNTAFNALPKTLTIDWRAVMLNGSSWWNSGGTTMLFSGGNTDAPGAALHEGGHGFQQLADEYGTCTGASCGTNTMGSGTSGTANPEINSCGNPATTDNKWTMWVGYNQTGATGVQGTFDGSRYIAIGAGQYRPSANSMMNSLFCGQNQAMCTANTAYNSVSREETVMAIWKRIHPIDSTDPAAGAVTSPGVLTVNVIDSTVISVDWTVDGTTMTNAGTTFNTASLAAGSHTISAKAYDNAADDLVRVKTSMCPSSVTGNYCHYTGWKNSIQTVTWTFTK
jgi:hypothetical protein